MRFKSAMPRLRARTLGHLLGHLPGHRVGDLGRGLSFGLCLIVIIVALAQSWWSPSALAAPTSRGDDLDRAERGSSSSEPTATRGGDDHPGTFGLGAILGSPSGLSAKLFFLHDNAFQLHLGFGFGRRGRLLIIGDYLFHFGGVLPRLGRTGSLTPYVGLGGRIGVRDDDDAVIGIRVPLGISLVFSRFPLEIFLEIGPGLGLVPETRALVDGGIGARWYF